MAGLRAFRPQFNRAKQAKEDQRRGSLNDKRRQYLHQLIEAKKKEHKTGKVRRESNRVREIPKPGTLNLSLAFLARRIRRSITDDRHYFVYLMFID
jgi:hypothetical protein